MPRRTTRGWWPAWPPSWNGRATAWSRWERRWHDSGSALACHAGTRLAARSRAHGIHGGGRMTLVVIDAVGLTPRALRHMPRVSKLGADGFSAALDTIVPAVTCSVQSTLLTG